MRIGIDARFLTHPQRGGFKTYSINLINAIHQLDAKNEYCIYVDRPYEPGQVLIKKNFHYRIVSGTFPIIGMPLREQALLRSYISKDHLDIFHSLCNTAPIGLKVKQITTLHDTIQVTLKIRLNGLRNLKYGMITLYSKWAIMQSLKNPGHIITVSAYEKSQILNLRNEIEPSSITVTHLAASEIFKQAPPHERRALSEEIYNKFAITGEYLLGIGYEDRKNIPLLIEAFHQLASEFSDLNLVIVAAEEGRKLYFQQLVEKYQLGERVRILGSVSPADLFALYNLAKIFVFPSERESFGLPPLEAISCGAPTVAMNSSSLPEILGEGAFFVEGKNVQQWVDTLRMVLIDQNLRSKMVESGLRRASELNWENCARNTIQVYEQVA